MVISVMVTVATVPGRDRDHGQRSPWPTSGAGRLLRWRGVLRDIERMSFWCCAQLDRRHERMALHCLRVVSGLTVYQPMIKSRRRESEPLFCNYVFVAVELQWHLIRWSPGVVGVLMSSDGPARVSDRVIEELRGREVNGLVRLPPPPKSPSQFESGETLRIRSGPLSGFTGLVAGMKPRARIEILLAALGRVEMAASAVERLA
jgi:transcription antitermination factor NusG